MADFPGTTGADSLTGTTGDDTFTGLGANDTLIGLAGNDSLDGGTGNDSMVGGTGDDTYVVDSASDTVVENAAEGTDTVQTSLTAYTLAADLENLTFTSSTGSTGTGNAANNVMVGGSGADTLSGGAGNDSLDGGAGADSLVGGLGDDSYVVDNASDTVVESASEGTDVVYTTLTTYTAGTNIEAVVYAGGSAAALTGNDANNSLTGAAGNDSLDGGLGNDTMTGGTGDDTYVVNAFGDVVTENSGEGTDLVQSSAASYNLSNFIENATITVSTGAQVQGNSLGNVLTGGAGSDTLIGNGGDDSLVGGAGQDNMQGGDGNDTFVVDNVNDHITESSSVSGGIDLVQSSVNIEINWLPAYVENLTLTGTATTGSGNGLANTITGNALDNVLDGQAGVDTMVGLAGNDTYYVDNSNDVVTEDSGAGTDVVYAKADYTLASNVENLILDGTSPIDGTGNSLDNDIQGNNAANLIDGGAGNDTMTGGGGSDTYIVDSSNDSVVEGSGGGTDTVRITAAFPASYTLGDNLERLEMLYALGGNWAVGNALNNTITGGAMSDTIDGGAGSDVLIGGTGDDTYVVDNVNDSVTENAGEGTDLVQSSVSYTLDAEVENLTLTGTSNVNAIGNDLANVLTGNDGNNKLDGGADSVADTLAGGLGDDTYVLGTGDDVDAAGDAGGTKDTIEVGRTFDLSSNAKYSGIENLTLTGTGDFNATGNGSANLLTGNSGDNVIDGLAGADTMVGGLGADTYYVDDAGDKITETGTDIDLVMASVSYSIASQGSIEKVTLTGTAANVTGNSLANTLTGNASANQLDGGTGADTLYGAAGDDTYVVDNAGDKVDETTVAGDGTDLVQSSISYTITDANIENLTLTGTGSISATGNSAANVLTGNSGANTLNGLGGNDTMAGGSGNDTYVLDSASDTVTENSGEGTADRVQIGVSYTLAAEVEELEITGTSAADGTGNVLANRMIGNSAANMLDGKGGNDTMIGGAGDDTYYVDSSSDVVTELAANGTDVVHTTVNYVLGDFVETLILDGTNDLSGTGNTNANSITGNDGANTIDGGTGADTMAGGLGNDIYFVDNVADVVTELTGQGVDTVKSTITFSLASLDNIENVTLLGTSNVNATGNASTNVLTGNSGNNSLVGGAGNDTMIGGDGNDSYTVTESGDIVTELSSPLGGIDQVTSFVNFTLGDYVENLILGAPATNGTGGKYANKLTGNALDNVLDGKAGNDTMIGGAGNDTYYVDASGDLVQDTAGTADVVNATASYTMSLGIETLNITGTTNINGTGNSEANVINGGIGNNIINGGGNADTMAGGAGNDTYYVDNSSDVVTEAASQGTDTVRSYITYTLASEIENLHLVGTNSVDGTGNTLANNMLGNSGANQLSGGTGADTMNGGAGNDTYIVDNVGDKVIELSTTGGTDEVQSSVTFSLMGYYLENLTLTGSAAASGTGNGLANVIAGNSGANLLNGGTGADTMSGGLGNDTFIVDNASDQVSENASEGTDTVQASVSYTISDADIENLVLLGASNINATGNSSANALYGNAGINTLDGGAGNDTMAGGGGNDVYIVDATGDVVVETYSGGTDTVQSSATWTISTYVEHLTLTGSGDINGTGNASANAMNGNSGDNVISAGVGNDTINGGAGNDTLTGGADSDLFVFSSSGAANEDLITDYNVAADTIRLSQSHFTALTQTGTIDSTDFFVVGSGVAANQHVYLSGTSLYYDADGYSTGAAGVLIAHFSSAVALTYQDITVL